MEGDEDLGDLPDEDEEFFEVDDADIAEDEVPVSDLAYPADPADEAERPAKRSRPSPCRKPVEAAPITFEAFKKRLPLSQAAEGEEVAEEEERKGLLRLQVIDIEHQKRWLPSEDMDDPEAKAGREAASRGGKWFVNEDGEVKRTRAAHHLVPCIRIYSKLEDGRSCCANVYGYYPVVRLLTACHLDNDRVVAELTEGVNAKLLEDEAKGKYAKKRPEGWRAVLCSRVVEGFPAFPYCEMPSNFLELKLSDASYVRAFGKLMRHESGELPTKSIGPVRVIPYSCHDIVDTFQADLGIAGFGWIELAQWRETDRESTFGDHSSCDLEIDCCLSWGIRPMPASAESDKIAPLRVITYDIECAKTKGTKGMTAPETDPVILIVAICAEYVDGHPSKTARPRKVILQHGTASDVEGVDESQGDVHLRFQGANAERDLLDAFGCLVHDFDPDYLCGHNMINFDQPYVVIRANRIDALDCEYLGRRRAFGNFQKPRRVVKKRKNGETRETTVTATPGRIQLDTLTWIMNGFVKERSYKLGALAAKYLGDTKDDVGYSMITPLWMQSDETRSRLAKYCLKDSELTHALCNHKQYQMVISSIEMSRQTHVPAGKLLRSGVQVKVWGLLLEKAKHPHFDDDDTPIFFPDEEVRERDKDDKFQGAEVLEPHRGYYGESWVGCGDFRSLYPSIIIEFNISYDTELVGDKYDGFVKFRASPTGTRFVDKTERVGLLPQIEEELMKNRDVAKAQGKAAAARGDAGAACMYDKRQNEIKIICNSVYGIMTASGGRLTRMEMGESVTSQGRLMIMTAKGIAEKQLDNTDRADTPFKVIYG